MENKEIFKNYMSIFGEMFDKALSPALTSIYWESFKSYTDDQCEKAFKDAIVTCKFFPKPAEIIELIMSTNKGYKALEAWTELTISLQNRVKDKLGHRDPEIKDETTIMTLHSIGGLDYILNTSQDNMRWVRKDFIDTYNIFNSKPKVDQKLLECPENIEKAMTYIQSTEQSRRHWEFKNYISMNGRFYWDMKLEKGEINRNEYCEKTHNDSDVEMINALLRGNIPDEELDQYIEQAENAKRRDELTRRAITK